MSLIKKKEFVGIDFTKFVMAIFVVAIHTNPLKDINNNYLIKIWGSITNVAVPFFFITSGYLLFLKLKKNPEISFQLTVIKSYIKRIVELYIYWTLIFLPITVWKFINNDLTFYKDIFLFFRGIFFIGENYYSWPLWYLLSMIYSLILIYFLAKRNIHIKYIFFVSILVFLISEIMNYIVIFKINNEFILKLSKIVSYSFVNGRLFSGMLYFMIGALFSNYKIKLSKSTQLVFIIIGTIFSFLKIPFISPFMFIFFPFAIFYMSLNFKGVTIKNGYFYRKCSTVMYFTHMIFLFLYTLIFKEFKYSGWDAFLISTITPIVLTFIVYNTEDKLRFFKKIF